MNYPHLFDIRIYSIPLAETREKEISECTNKITLKNVYSRVYNA